MPKSVLDTDIFSEILKGIDPVVVQNAAAYHAIFGHYTISAITVMEIVKGLHKVNREERIQQFLQGLVQVETLPSMSATLNWLDEFLLTLSAPGSPSVAPILWLPQSPFSTS